MVCANKKLLMKILVNIGLYFSVSFCTCESKLMYTCQNGFSKFRSNCYYLSTKMATWQEAYFECKYLAKGSKLVVLSKEVDDHNIGKFLKYRKNGKSIMIYKFEKLAHNLSKLS